MEKTEESIVDVDSDSDSDSDSVSESKNRSLEISSERESKIESGSESESKIDDDDCTGESDDDDCTGESDDDGSTSESDDDEYISRSKRRFRMEYNLEPESGEESLSDSETETDIEIEKLNQSLSYEELEVIYSEQIKSSDGFYVTAFPNIPGETFGAITRLPKWKYKHGGHVCRMAVELHNKVKPENQHLKYIKLLYGTRHGCAGIMYFLTFRAKELSTDKIDEYQAKVWVGVEYDTLFIFRLKPPQDNNQNDIGGDCNSTGAV